MSCVFVRLEELVVIDIKFLYPENGRSRIGILYQDVDESRYFKIYYINVKDKELYHDVGKNPIVLLPKDSELFIPLSSHPSRTYK
jgi:hypothetical protein